MSTVIWILVADALVMGFLSANLWHSRGGQYETGFALGFFLGVLGLIYVAAARPGGNSNLPWPPNVGDSVLVARSTTFNGERVPGGTRGTVIGADLIDGELFVKITGDRWVPLSHLRPSGRPPEATKLCPDCAERVQSAARICRYCGFRFDPADAP